MADRWTKKQLEEISDADFIMCILNERKNGLNYYSLLSQKIDKAKSKLIEFSNIFKNKKEIYGVFQTDVWQTKSSYVNFGYYSSIDLANMAIQENDLVVEDAKAVIEAFKIDEFGEDNGYEVACYEYEDFEDDEEEDEDE